MSAHRKSAIRLRAKEAHDPPNQDLPLVMAKLVAAPAAFSVLTASSIEDAAAVAAFAAAVSYAHAVRQEQAKVVVQGGNP